jgi:sugar/nucleoside kinase (ribokinase family)
MTFKMNEVDYLAIGHVTRDIKRDGFILGGTVSYSGLTALALGRKVGIVTSCDDTIDLSPLEQMQIHKLPSQFSTTFENRYTDGIREQRVHTVSLALDPAAIPMEWKSTKLVHLGPVANEVDPQLIYYFDNSFIGITPQGWVRKWDNSGRVYFAGWKEIAQTLSNADAVVLSIEDLHGDETLVAELAQDCRILAITRGAQGATVFVKGSPTSIPAPRFNEVDPTGSGDIFATAFFISLQESENPIEAGKFATLLASHSISGSGLESVPRPSDIQTLRDRLDL